MFRGILTVTLLALTTMSCADAPAPTELRSSPALAQIGADSRGVSGSGHVQQPAGLREFTFHAVELLNGSVGGSYKIVLPSGLFFEVDVTCLAVNANTGWIAGTIRATNAGAVVIGSVSTVYVIDNGEGVDAVDIVSTATFNGAAGGDAVFCANRPLALPQLSVIAGNVQVR